VVPFPSPPLPLSEVPHFFPDQNKVLPPWHCPGSIKEVGFSVLCRASYSCVHGGIRLYVVIHTPTPPHTPNKWKGPQIWYLEVHKPRVKGGGARAGWQEETRGRPPPQDCESQPWPWV
jgi:hypothetical protein